MIKKFWGGHSRGWMWPVWSQDSKIDCISRMNRWNKLIFCMLVQIKENYKLFNDFWVGLVKSGSDHLVHETPKSAVSEEWVYELSFFFVHWLWCNNLWLDQHHTLYLTSPLQLHLIDDLFHGSSWKDPMKQHLSILPSCHLSRYFLGIGLLDLSKFWHGAKTLLKLCVTESDFLEKHFLCPELGKWVKNRDFWI